MTKENRKTLKAVYKALKTASDEDIVRIFRLLMREINKK